MEELIKLGEIEIIYKEKKIKNIHLSVHPPYGMVTLVAPEETRFDVARAYAISKLRWIREQQKLFIEQAREYPLEFVERESHYLWGKRYLLSIEFSKQKPSVELSNKKIILKIRKDSSKHIKENIMQEWYRSELHKVIPKIINKWQDKLGVKVNEYSLRRMKTKWGSCNTKKQKILINTELAKKPKDLLEYIVVHEIAHIIEPSHNKKFLSILDDFFPTWREARLELNNLPIGGYSKI